jgi:cell division protein FtsI/penicillin-binding protein 2
MKMQNTVDNGFRNRMSPLMIFFAQCAVIVVAGIPVIAAPSPVARHVRHRQAARVSSFGNPYQDDVATFDDTTVRQAAIRALGKFTGSVVAIDPGSGRILSIVNQKLAFSEGFIPCSTIKPVIAVAALQEGFVTRDTKIQVSRRKSLTLTDAIAHSNNAYFEELGRRMGFGTVSAYARTMGLGELAGYEIAQERAGIVPSQPPARGGVARMSSFGEGIRMTPLQLGAIASMVANGGTLYYLQYPQTLDEQNNFEPRIKRALDVQASLPDLREGMHAAVMRGTARRSNMTDGEEVSGKTGSCSESGSRIGWFASYIDQADLKMVLVILMRGHTYAVRGPMAAGIAGRIYHQLEAEKYRTRREEAYAEPPAGKSPDFKQVAPTLPISLEEKHESASD